jgi:hypothetical protein
MVTDHYRLVSHFANTQQMNSVACIHQFGGFAAKVVSFEYSVAVVFLQ